MPKNIRTKLRIGLVIDDGLDRPDGVQQYVLSVGSWLEKQGHEVCYLAGETKRKDIKVNSLSRNLKVRFNGNTLSTPLPVSTKKLKKLLLEKKLDVLHVQVPYSPFLAGRLVRFARRKTRIIGTFHILPVGKTQSLANRFLALLLKTSLKKFDKVLSVSAPARDFAKKTYGIDSAVLPNPVDTKKFKPVKPKRTGEDINIVFLGRLVPRKGCMKLLMAVEMLLRQPGLPKIKLDICGDGPERTALQKLINGSALKSVAKLHGFVSEKDKIKFLNLADLAVFPSLGGESFGIVLIEAMAAGSGVVLAGNNPGYASVLSSDEYLFDPKNTEELSGKLHELILDDKKRATLHKKQQALVRKFDINKIGEELLEIYTQS